MKRRMSSVTALLLFFTAALLVPFGLRMFRMTVTKAREIQELNESEVKWTANRFNVDYAASPELNSWDEYRLQFLHNIDVDDETARSAAVLFENGEPVTQKHGYAFFEYWSDSEWYSGGIEVMTQGESDEPLLILDRFPDDPFTLLSELATLSIDLEFALKDDQALLQQIMADGALEADILRLTGYAYNPDGGWWLENFIPTAISSLQITDPDLYAGKPLGQRDAEGQLVWEDIYRISPDRPIAEEVQAWFGEEAQWVEIFAPGGMQYLAGDTLEQTYAQMDPELHQMLLEEDHTISYSLFETVIVESKTGVDQGGNYHELWVALRCYPLREAIKELRYTYLLSFVLFLILIFLLRVLLERWLEKPLQQIIESTQNNMAPIRSPYWGRFSDIVQVQQGYMNAQKELQTLRQENTRLQTALEYAENAEMNRRQMVSNITHELKTPLAVIHSYCEGLQAGIAPEKQEKYLDVITGEADRMDAMVLEMLDLSRLEAGKVRLSQDQVELLGLTQSILEKLNPLLEVKQLTLEYGMTSTCHLTADESRLTQVITNLATNAIKYSPEGGKIIISVIQRNGLTRFSIENESTPLSEEALEKVWESFYRTEQSRTTKGTGLGLPICKAIIELHRGTCSAQNTSTGVEFSFIIP